jgi:hypothetical protein
VVREFRSLQGLVFEESVCQPPNKQLQRTVTRRRGRAACASFHCAHAARWTLGHAAAELRRYTSLDRASVNL